MFVQIITGRVSDAQGFRRQMQRWMEELRPGARGFLGTTGGITADGTAILLARFADAAAARANSERPEQGAWWADTARCFDAEPTFEETSDVQVLLGGGSDEAGFVQVMRASVPDRTTVAELDALFSAAAPTWRPDVIGGYRAWVTPTDAVDITYFTSEAAARAGEATPPPPELAGRMGDYEALVAGSTFYDLSDPVLGS